MRRNSFGIRLLMLMLGSVMPVWPSMLRGQPETTASHVSRSRRRERGGRAHNTGQTIEVENNRRERKQASLASRGKQDGFLWDVEQMFQTGQFNNRLILADAVTAGGGYHFENVLFHPTVWAYYDFASGSGNPTGNGTYSTFNQLFPFSHYYLGWLDLVGRQNIQDLNAHLYLYPTKWIRFWVQYHHFELANSHDALYNAGGVPTTRDPTGRAGTNVGDEMDFIVNFHLTNTSDILMGYSHLFPGLFLINTGTKIAPDQVFVQYVLRI